MFLVRELTKMYEQQVLGTAADVAAALDDPVRGEICLVVEGDARLAALRQAQGDYAAAQGHYADAQGDGISHPELVEGGPERVGARIDALLAEGLTTSAVAKRLAEAGFGERRHLYALVSERRGGRREP